MFLRRNRVTVTDLDIMLFLYKSDRSLEELTEFLSAASTRNAHTYLYRLKQKKYIERKSASRYQLTPHGRALIETLKSSLSAP